jgi:hypothetical protein
MQTVHRYKSVRNGFVVASVLLVGFLSVQFVQQGDWDFAIGSAFFLSQVAFWVTWAYYSR